MYKTKNAASTRCGNCLAQKLKKNFIVTNLSFSKERLNPLEATGALSVRLMAVTLTWSAIITLV